MAAIEAHGLTIGFGFGLLLDDARLTLAAGERVCLVGRNGTGKTTLMKILAGLQAADHGTVVSPPHSRIAYLQQAVPDDLSGNLLDIVLGGTGEGADLLSRYETLAESLSDPPTEGELNELQSLQEELDRLDAWTVRSDAAAALAQLDLEPSDRFEALSGGRKRQCLLIRAIVARPHVLILDEPTNHLDIAAIDWLEDLVRGFRGAVLFVTHDRAFLRAAATRILDLDRGKLTSWPGNFEQYQERKQASLDAEAKAWREFDKTLAKEEAWIREGIKARRTRNEGRVRALKKLRLERKARRERIGQAKIAVQEGGRSGARVIEAKKIAFAWPDQPIVDGFDLTLLRGDRVGVIGPNGCGKTTLLRLLLGTLEPQSGTVREGTKLLPLYFDQLRNQLDDDRTVQQNLCDDGDTVFIDGKPRHVISYLGDFLFSPVRARSRVAVLSGGERNRLLLAKLFTNEANLLVLDEPTNDLDTETLELLETTLLTYRGTLIVVSHDREFLNNVVTSCIAFDHDGGVRQYVGGYDDWVAQRPAIVESSPEDPSPKPTAEPEAPKVRKLTFKERHELDALPGQIEGLEAEQARKSEALNDPSLYNGPNDELLAITERQAVLDAELLQAYARWEVLSERA
jgi:ABC transport system ATP-binding/permease protein